MGRIPALLTLALRMAAVPTAVATAGNPQDSPLAQPTVQLRIGQKLYPNQSLDGVALGPTQWSDSMSRGKKEWRDYYVTRLALAEDGRLFLRREIFRYEYNKPDWSMVPLASFWHSDWDTMINNFRRLNATDAVPANGYDHGEYWNSLAAGGRSFPGKNVNPYFFINGGGVAEVHGTDPATGRDTILWSHWDRGNTFTLNPLMGFSLATSVLP